MPILIAVSHQKGGVGKSSLVLGLAAYFAEQKLKVGIADMDKQGTISSLFGEVEAYKTAAIELLPNFSINELSPYAKLDAIFIDTPPYLSNDLTTIFSKVHFLLIPTKPALADVMAIRATIAMYKEALVKNPNLKCGVVLNMTTANASQEKIRTTIEGFGAKVMNVEINKRVSYERCLAHPRHVFNSNDKKAIAEMENLAAEILTFIKNK